MICTVQQNELILLKIIYYSAATIFFKNGYSGRGFFRGNQEKPVTA
jgi:hypothetical protein